eukprot:TRINITY_DN1164_c0_g1_i1.p1 TRINITY_DN1164_c0_g1~~TRINITY_DN1164_c0_g1_i1.p1  ORF type:complete len:242 (-),score=93.25 TRINITY_DN1164_c0_g1_i1:234-959(-)
MPSKKGKKEEKKEEVSEEEEEEEQESGEESEEEEKPKAKEEKKDDDKKEEAAPPAAPEFKPHDKYPPMTAAEKVLYCPTCSLPGDFCQYGPCWDKCKPWCMEYVPWYYPELSGISLDDAKKKAEEATEKSKVKELPGGKVKRSKSPEVTIKKLSRGGRKCVTSVAGLDGFGINLDGAAKTFKKKFACGCAAVKGDAGHPDTVDIQGDFEHELIEVIRKEFKEIPLEKISVLEGGTKKKGKK